MRYIWLFSDRKLLNYLYIDYELSFRLLIVVDFIDVNCLPEIERAILLCIELHLVPRILLWLVVFVRKFHINLKMSFSYPRLRSINLLMNLFNIISIITLTDQVSNCGSHLVTWRPFSPCWMLSMSSYMELYDAFFFVCITFRFSYPCPRSLLMNY